ncbi:MAG: BTAD domain-containing putative transcriptional regulator [Acidimicrobiales bacterium]
MGTGSRVGLEVLGPLRVWDEAGVDITPSGVLQRRLLALLVLRRGQVVTVDAAIEALWPSEMPRDAVAALQNHLSRLRHLLPVDVIESVASGYRLDPIRVDVDADRLGVLLADGSLDATARIEVHELLAGWRGPAYPELEDVDAAWGEAAGLEELRVRATEALAEARLAAGDTGGLVADLTGLVAREPLRERPHALLMSALAAMGRTAEALRVYDDFRRILGDELGIAPSPALHAQHSALLGGSGPTVPHAEITALPEPATALVGRERLLDELLVRVERARVLTLVGPGGVGKTRLLLEVGRCVGSAEPDRWVVFCELARADSETAIDAVALALGIDARLGVSPTGRVVELLGSSDAVLLVDNCEHVLDAIAEFVETVVRRCPNVTVLATSRERLRVPGEHVCVVSTLLAGGDDAAAVELFVERARTVRPGFEPEGDERACVVEIVRRLDGLPLAIELAAARLHTHEVREIAAGLDRPLSLLSAGFRTSLRHSSLAAVVAWSYELLGDELQEVFAALSIFAGPFSVRDAAAVCGTGPEPAADALAQLVERSLVIRVPGSRFVLLETLRAFGINRLSVSGRVDLVGERHAGRMMEWVTDAAEGMHVPGGPGLAEVDDAIAELRSALGWLLDHQLAEDAGRLVDSLANYAVLRLRPDVLAWSERVIASDPENLSPVASRMWAAAAYAAWMAGDMTELEARSHRAVAVAERNDVGMSQLAATIRGNVELFEGRLEAAAGWYRRAVEAAANPTQRWIARGAELLALGYAGQPHAGEFADAAIREVGELETAPAAYVWYCAAEAVMLVDVELARARFTRSVELAELTKASFVQGLAGASKASIEARYGDPRVAAADYRWLIPHWQRAGMWSTQWTMLRSIVGVLERLGRHREAAVLEGAVRATDAGHRIFGADELALREIGARLRTALGSEIYEVARSQGAVLDGRTAAEHALASL